MVSPEDVVTRVRNARKKRRWTQAELAENAGVSLGTVQNFEGRKSAPQPENLRNMMRAVGLEVDDAEVAEATRAEWPGEVQVFLDMMGAYLMSMQESERMTVIHDLTRQIFSAHRVSPGSLPNKG